MENLVVSLETAKKLEAAGFGQKAEFYWVITMTTNYHLSWYPDGDLPLALEKRNDCFAAPTAQEVADELPENHVNSITHRSARLKMFYENNEWTTGYPGDFYVSASTMAEALALVWLKSKEAPNAK